jgi:hypothetical protein
VQLRDHFERYTNMPLFAILLANAITLHAAQPDPVELARRSSRAIEANGKALEQYAYREYVEQRSVNADGKVLGRTTETWEIIGLEGSSYRKLVARNDQPLSPKEQKREDARMKAEADLRRNENPEQRKKRLFTLYYSYRLPYNKLADVFDVKYAGEREFGGRTLQVIEAAPKLDYEPKTPDERESRNYQLTLWLDPDDAFPMRIEAEIVGSQSRMEKGTSIRQDFVKLPDGFWAPKVLTIRFSAKMLKMHRIRGDKTHTYDNFRKFSAESTIQFTGK